MLDALRTSLGHSFRALRHRNFRLFASGQFVSLIGTWMQTVALGWLVYRLTRSPALRFARALPALRAEVRPIYVRLGIIPEIAAGLEAGEEPPSAVAEP